MPDDPNNPAGTVVADPAADGTKTPPAASAEDVKAVQDKLNELQRSMSAARTTDEADVARKQFLEKHKLTQEQLDGVSALVETQVNQRMAVTNRGVGEDRAKASLGNAAAELMPEVQRIMATYPPANQGDPKVWEDVSKYVIGNNVQTFLKHNPPTDGGNNGGSSNGPHIRSAQVPGFQRANPPSSNGGNNQPGKYSDEELQIIARMHGGDAADYEKYKNTRSVVDDKYYSKERGTPKF